MHKIKPFWQKRALGTLFIIFLKSKDLAERVILLFSLLISYDAMMKQQ